MDKAIPRILKSIVQTHGLAFTQSPSLCKAYLADLMPNFVEERQQLIAAVAYELPQKLLETQNRQQHKALALQFGQANSLPPLQALQMLDTWLYALPATAYSEQPSTWFYSRNWIYYLSGLLTGSLALLLGSAIAVYKKPEMSIPAQTLTANPNPASSVAKPNPTLTNILVNQPKLSEKTIPLLSKQTTKSRLVFPSLLSQWSKLDDLEPEQAAQQTQLPLLFTSQPKSFTQGLAVTIPKNDTPLTATKLADQKTASNNLSKSENQINKINKSATQPSHDQKPKKTQSDLKKHQAETESLFNKNTQAVQNLVEHSLDLQKKLNDRQALNELLKLTGDKFYGNQLAELDRQIQVLNLRIDHLSAAYSKQVTQLCEQAPHAWQDKQLTTKKSHAKQIQVLVLKHWQYCKTLSSQHIKQHVLNPY